MIRDGMIAYGAKAPTLLTLEFENKVLNTFVVALLTTILSYQAAGFVFDLVLGIKPTEEARIRDLHILLLTRQSSPFAVVTSILRNDSLTKRFYRGHIADHTEVRRDDESIKIWTVSKLVFLLAIVPVLNVVSIVLSFSRDQMLTFREAQFGGIALGVNRDLAVVSTTPLTKTCKLAKMDVEEGDNTNVTFSLCEVYSRTVLGGHTGNATVIAGQLSSTGLNVFVGVNENFIHVVRSGEITMRNESTSFIVKPLLSMRDKMLLADFGMTILAQACGLQNTSTVFSYVEEETDSIISTNWCPSAEEDVSMLHETAVAQIAEKITYVNAETFDVLRDVEAIANEIDEEDPVLSADDFSFITRTRRFSGLPILAIATAGAVLAKLAGKVFFNSDSGEGLMLLLKKRFGLLWWESLLRNGYDVVKY